MHTRLLATLLLTTCLAACGWGYRYNYDDTLVYPAASGPATLGLAVMDVRSYVLSDYSNPGFVGVKGGHDDSSYQVHTRSRDPFQQDVAVAITAGLQRKDLEVVSIGMSFEDLQNIPAAMARSGVDRTLFLRIYEWRTESRSQMELYYRLALEVYDGSGTRLALAQIDGEGERMGEVVLESSEGALAAAVLSEKLGKLLNDNKIMAALGTQQALAAR